MTVAAYRDRTSGEYPITFAAMRQRVGHMLISDMEPPETWVLDEANVDPVFATDQPAYDDTTHSVAEGEPEKVDGAWRQTWVVEVLPIPERTFTWLEFMDLFTEPEQVELAGAAMTDPTMKLWYDRALGAQGIFMSDPRTTIGVDYAVQSGLIAASRRDDILAGRIPNV